MLERWRRTRISPVRETTDRRLNSYSRVSIRFWLRTLAKTGSGQARREAETNGAFY
jgi:hypothetical protein